MDYLIKYFGKVGLLLAILAFLVLFIQNSLGTGYIEKIINHNMLYDYDIILDRSLKRQNNIHICNIFVICKNSGLDSLSRVRFNVESLNPSVKAIYPVDSSSFSKTNSIDLGKSPFFRATYEFKGEIYPQEILIKYFNLELSSDLMSDQDINEYVELRVFSHEAPAIRIKNMSKDRSVNYKNLDLLIRGIQLSLFKIMILIVLPITVFFGIGLFAVALIKRIIKRTQEGREGNS